MNSEVEREFASKEGANSQGGSHPKMAQVTIVKAKDRTAVLPWERGLAVLTIARMNAAYQITLCLALGVEKIVTELANECSLHKR